LKAKGNLTIGDKKEIDRAVWRKPHGIRLTPTSRYVRDRLFGHSSSRLKSLPTRERSR
jgi:hypothetical protein